MELLGHLLCLRQNALQLVLTATLWNAANAASNTKVAMMHLSSLIGISFMLGTIRGPPGLEWIQVRRCPHISYLVSIQAGFSGPSRPDSAAGYLPLETTRVFLGTAFGL